MFNYTSPEKQGVDSLGIVRFLDEMKQKKLHMHSVMILRHGNVVLEQGFEPWSTEQKHMLFSLSKSFTSTAVGFASQDGLLSVEDRLIDYFPELLTNPPCENMQKMKLKHLLTMNTGHKSEPSRHGDNWEKTFLQSYIEYEPGTHFLYNTTATYMLSAVVQKVTGKKLVDYLREKLFKPLSMSEDIWTEESPTGVATGGFGLNVRVNDIAKLGQFYLQNGVWEGKQLLNADWIQAAQTPWSDNSAHGGAGTDWGSGYGYQFWMCTPEKVFRGDGAFGQYCVICPAQDMVIAINSGIGDMGAVLKSIWNNIFPALDTGAEHEEALKERLKSCVVPAVWEDEGEQAEKPILRPEWTGGYLAATPNLAGISGFSAESSALKLDFGGETNEIPLEMDAWRHITLKRPKEQDEWGYFENAAVRAALVRGELVIHLCYTSTPFEDTYRFSFTEHGAKIKALRNVSFMGDDGVEILCVKR